MDLSFRGYHLSFRGSLVFQGASILVSHTPSVLGPRRLLHPHWHFKTPHTFLLYCSHGKNTGVVCLPPPILWPLIRPLIGKNPDAGKD